MEESIVSITKLVMGFVDDSLLKSSLKNIILLELNINWKNEKSPLVY